MENKKTVLVPFEQLFAKILEKHQKIRNFLKFRSTAPLLSTVFLREPLRRSAPLRKKIGGLRTLVKIRKILLSNRVGHF